MQLPMYLGGIAASLAVLAVIVVAAKYIYSLIVAQVRSEPITEHLKSALISVIVAVIVIASASPFIAKIVSATLRSTPSNIPLPY